MIKKAAKMAVLLSGSGRTLDNFHKHIQSGLLEMEIEVVIANKENAFGLQKAKRYGYPSFYCKDNENINSVLQDFSVDIIALAGFLKMYQPPLHLEKSVVNIHPSLIPSFCGPGFYGHYVHEAVRARGCLVSGCTVHFANQYFDEGPIIYQQAVSLNVEDDAETIAEKVFAAECKAYPKALQQVVEKGKEYFWERV